MDLEIKPIIIDRPKGTPFEKIKTGSITGKSIDYIKKVIIPVLKQRNYRLKQRLNEAKDTIKRLRKEKADAIAKVKNASWSIKKKEYAISQSELNRRSKEWYYDKVKIWRLNASTLMDGVTAYPIIQQWARREKLPYAYLSLFILLNHFNSFCLKDGEAYGFTYSATRKHIEKLIEWGWVNKYPSGRKNIYSVSSKGVSKFKEIQAFYKKQTIALLMSYDRKFTSRSGGTTVKFRGKELYKIKNVYAEATQH